MIRNGKTSCARVAYIIYRIYCYEDDTLGFHDCFLCEKRVVYEWCCSMVYYINITCFHCSEVLEVNTWRVLLSTRGKHTSTPEICLCVRTGNGHYIVQNYMHWQKCVQFYHIDVGEMCMIYACNLRLTWIWLCPNIHTIISFLYKMPSILRKWPFRYSFIPLQLLEYNSLLDYRFLDYIRIDCDNRCFLILTYFIV